MRYLTAAFGIGAMPAVSARAQGDKPNFSGSWQVNPTRSEVTAERPHLVWMKIYQKGDTIDMARGVRTADGKVTVAEMRCSVKGEDCNVDATIKVTFTF